ncbi:nitrogen fixation protein [Flavonifractor plautii]|uniref:nitrogen fixation protein n=1 Tax=Flavonifractor plautii TaxID=292800 RepID=UPI0018994B15|nr:nitrogen fixation protein [Flavonifractor plautii]MDB7876638.1 nitrogen fixation protein [Flavonifractor plautii]
MNKNFNTKNITEEIKDVPVNTTMGGVTKLLDLLFEVIDMNADLIALIREEAELKKHHRAYLHIREELEDCTDWTSTRMQGILEETRGCVIGLMQDVHKTFRAREHEADDDDTVTIAKEDYDTMIDDLLTMSEIIQCVADMRTQDVKAIREFGKFVPAFAAFEKNRLSLYREAAKEAEEIFDRWADEIDDLDEDFMEDEDYEPDEYYSD